MDWSEQKCGVHQASLNQALDIMPGLRPIFESLPEDPSLFIWDVKVHMLMPGQFPCIPNWHYDNVPRVNNKQDFDLIRKDKPMYLWISNEPLTEFRSGDRTWHIKPRTWTRFTQVDEHRGTKANDFCWRGFIRATHKDIAPANKSGRNPERSHSQVYLDVNNFAW